MPNHNDSPFGIKDQKLTTDNHVHSEQAPFNLAVPIINNIDDLPHDPAVISTLHNANALAITHAQADAIIPKDVSDRATEGQQTLKDYDVMHDRLKQFYPEIAQHIDDHVIETARLNPHRPWIAEKEKMSLLRETFERDQSFVAPLKNDKPSGIIGMAKLQDLQAREHIGENFFGKGATVHGSEKEWAALLDVHELGHASNSYQKPITDYFNQLSKKDGKDYSSLASFTKEAESDLTTLHSNKDQVSSTTRNEWIAGRINGSNQFGRELYNAQWTDHDKKLQPAWTDIANDHGIGYADAEYMKTGQIPDLKELNENVSGFQQKTAQYYLDATKAELKRRGYSEIDTRQGDRKTNNSQLDRNQEPLLPTNREVMTDVVRRGMVDGIYSPREEQMAQHYMDAMKIVMDDRKEKPQDMNKVICTTLDQNGNNYQPITPSPIVTQSIRPN